MKVYVKMCMVLLAASLCVVFVSGSCFAVDEPDKAVSTGYVQAYYFHATKRCKTCTTIEQYSRQTIDTHFKEQMGDGTLRFAGINFDEPENRHYLQDYQLLYRALVIVLYRDGKQVKYKNLEKIWQYKGNKVDFSNYVKSEIETMLQEL